MFRLDRRPLSSGQLIVALDYPRWLSFGRLLRPRSACVPGLHQLDMRGNRITALPAALLDLARLDKLDLRWNRLSEGDRIVGKLTDRGVLVHG